MILLLDVDVSADLLFTSVNCSLYLGREAHIQRVILVILFGSGDDNIDMCTKAGALRHLAHSLLDNLESDNVCDTRSCEH